MVVCLANAGGSESTNTSTAIGNTEDDQATVYQTNRISTSFAYIFGPADGLMPGQTYTVGFPPKFEVQI